MRINRVALVVCLCLFWLVSSAGLGLAQVVGTPPPQAQPQAAQPQAAPAAAAPAQAGMVCGGQATCYETGDFAATVTNFRVSAVNGWKIIDTTLRFVNKTAQPLVLAYTDG